MAPPKPWWLWKAPKCAEIAHFDIPFAVKEYLQNQVGQIQKEKRTREWSDWCVDDLRTRPSTIREECKTRLVRTYPGLLTGPHGASLRQDPGWQPVYVVSGIVPRDELKTPYDTDLVICTVLWNYHHPTTGDSVCSAMSFFNNHVDEEASFSTFVIDGATTSRTKSDAVGEKGKGFVLATQYFHEQVEEQDAYEALKIPDRKWNTGVSFRVGHQVGELSWRNSRTKLSANCEKQLMVVMDDLTPWSTEQFLSKLGIHDDDESDVLSLKRHDHNTKLTEVKRQAAMKVLGAIYKRRFAQKLSDRARSSASIDAQDPRHEINRVRPDEVSITVIGLPGDLVPTEAFSGVYGIIEYDQAWRVLPQVETPVYFFRNTGPPLFYHRDHIIRSGPALNRLSINYRGDLDLSADRTAVIKGTPAYHAYRDRVSRAAHLAFEFLPDLATEIALDILTDPGLSGSTLSRLLHPIDAKSAAGYQAAFNEAWRTLDPALPADKILYPYPVSSTRDIRLIEELGMIGRPVADHVMVKILQPSGAFTRVHHYAESLLLKSPPHRKPVAGFTRLQRAIASVFPSVKPEDVIMANYKHSGPKMLWDPKTRKFVLGVPAKCSEHSEGGCLCWVGPYLFRAMDSWKDKNRSTKDGPSLTVLCRAFLQCMDGTTGTAPSSEILKGLEQLTVTIARDDDTLAGDITPREHSRRGSESSVAVSMLQPAVPSRSPSPVPMVPSEASTPIVGIFKEMLDLCNSGLKEASAVDSERATMKSNHRTSVATLKSWQDQATQNQDELEQMRKLLAEKDAELQHTRKLLTDKWTGGDKAQG